MYIGEPYSWAPSAFFAEGWRDAEMAHRKLMVHGRIVYINEAHRYFTAEATVGGVALRESFKY